VAVEVVQFSDGDFGGWFDPDDYKSAVAIVFEPTDHDEEGGEYKGKKHARTTVDITTFHDLAKLDAADPEVRQDVYVEKSVLCKQLKDLLGKAVIVTVTKKSSNKPGGNDYWTLKSVDPQIHAKVEEYLEAREAAADDLIG